MKTLREIISCMHVSDRSFLRMFGYVCCVCMNHILETLENKLLGRIRLILQTRI